MLKNLYGMKRPFRTVNLDSYTKSLVQQKPEGPWLVELNRRLLQTAFKDIEIASPELFPDYVDYYVNRMIALVRKKLL